MTLVMYIPHEKGCILIADRQDTATDSMGLCKREVRKLYLVSEKGPAIGCSGDTEFTQDLFEKLKERANIDNDNIMNVIETLLLEVGKRWEVMHGPHVYPLEEIELIVVTYKDGEIMPYYMHGLLRRSLERTRCHGIGAGETATGPFLNYNTCDLHEEGAVKWGEEIMRQVALVNYTVGPPEYHGYDVINISNDGAFKIYSEAPRVRREIDITSTLRELRKVEIVKEESK